MGSFSFRDLNLKDVQVSGPSLTPGSYVGHVVKAEIQPTRTGGHQCVVTLKEEATGALITDYINVNVPSSEEATNIGRSRLKALLTFGGHPNPDNPGDIKTLNKLRVGFKVIEEEYEKDGKKRMGTKLARGGAYFSPQDGAASDGAASSGGSAPATGVGSAMDDDIPF
jgi:hypothetical protein